MSDISPARNDDQVHEVTRRWGAWMVMGIFRRGDAGGGGRSG
nr:hypothetical protein [Mycobacterium sp.]